MKLCWLDLETTGLNPFGDAILEIALLVEEDGREILRYEKVLSWKGEPSWLDPVVRKMHERNGLLEEARRADWSDAVGFRIRDMFRAAGIEPKSLHLAGNSVHFDLRFLMRYMPMVVDYFHHRILDMSSVAIFADMLGHPRPPKGEAHRAMADLEESRRYLQHYLRVFRPVR